MEARQLIAGVFAHMRRKGRDRTGVARFQLGKGLQITLGRGVLILLDPQRLEGAQGFRPAPQQQVAYRPAVEVLHFCREDRADANAGAELLVGGFQSRGDVDGVAIGRVVEEAAAAEIADDRRSGMNADACGAQRDSFLVPALAESLRVFVQSQCAGDRSGRMVRLLARGSEQHVQGIADDFCDGAVVREHEIGHAGEVVIQQRPKHVGLERLHQCGEAGNVGEHRCDLAPLSAEIDRVRIAGKPFCQIGREVARERRMRPFGLRLPPPCLAQGLDMPDGLGDRRLEIEKVDRLGQKIERAAVHRSANVGDVAIGGDDDGGKLLFVLLQFLQQREPIHPRHIDVGHHQIDVVVFLQHSQSFDAVAREQKVDAALANLTSELLLDEFLQVRLVVDNQDPCGHAARSTRVSISLRSAPKSMGLVRRASAPPSSALRLVSASP